MPCGPYHAEVSTSLRQPADTADAVAAATARRPWALVGVAVVILLTAVFALLRNPGEPPFGSDHDEYRMVAQSLLAGNGPVVAGVEGTKYPLGYPLLLAALDVVGLPVTATALGLNILMLAAVVLVVGHLTRPLQSRWAQLAAAVFVVGNVALWGGAFAVMPDVAITLLAALMLWRMQRIATVRDVLTVAALGAVATSVKSVGLLIAGAASVALLVRAGRLRWWFWVPGGAAVLAAAVQALWVAAYPDHTTGYATVFWLNDPYDVASGRASLLEVGARLFTRIPDVVQDVGDAVVGPHIADVPGALIAGLLLAVGVWAYRQNRAFAVALIVVYGVGLTLWPFESLRFGLPFVPLAAVGVGGAVAALQRASVAWRTVGYAATGAVLAVALLAGGRQVQADAQADGDTYRRLNAGTQQLAAWVSAEVPAGDVLASLDYREIAFRIDRRVVPLPYSSDTEDLLRRVRAGGSRWFVAYRDVYRRRSSVTRAFVRDHRDTLDLVYRNEAVSVWSVRP
jgi:hypothetical protein